ncbi:MAG: hypothetical protein ACXVX8_00695 [Blastococcus sp.]
MRATIVAGAMAGMVLLTGGTAVAATPRLSWASCHAGGGTFHRVGYVATCRTTSVADLTSDPYVSPPFERDLGGVVVTYEGTSQTVATTQTTTTQRQWRHRPVTTRTTTQVLGSSVQVLTCRVTADYLGVTQTSTVAPDVCVNPQNYPLSSLFF